MKIRQEGQQRAEKLKFLNKVLHNSAIAVGTERRNDNWVHFTDNPLKNKTEYRVEMGGGGRTDSTQREKYYQLKSNSVSSQLNFNRNVDGNV